MFLGGFWVWFYCNSVGYVFCFRLLDGLVLLVVCMFDGLDWCLLCCVLLDIVVVYLCFVFDCC